MIALHDITHQRNKNDFFGGFLILKLGTKSREEESNSILIRLFAPWVMHLLLFDWFLRCAEGND